MPLSLDQFVANLAASRLMSAAEVSAFIEAKRPQDAQSLAAELVRAGKLTKYQAQAVFQGKTKGLVLGDYVVLEKLGQGGMGQVFKYMSPEQALDTRKADHRSDI